jgi:hypothetical protein
MTDEKLVERLETYANAITAFMVVQSLGLAFSLGTNPGFACLAFSEGRLNAGLQAHFAGTFLLACVAMALFYRAVRRMQADHLAVFRLLYIGRAVAAALFVAIPLAVLHAYATDAAQSQACRLARQ